MSKVDDTFYKCGEIFLSKTKGYTLLCDKCNAFFSEFAEFIDHNLAHLNTRISNNDEIDFDINNSVKEKRLEFIEIDRFITNENESCLNAFNNVKLDEEKQDYLDLENITYNTDESLDCEQIEDNIEQIFCIYCKDYYDAGIHDSKSCFQKQDIIKTCNGDFIELLQNGILYCSCKRYFENYKILYDHHVKENHCSFDIQCNICKLNTFMTAKINSTRSLKMSTVNEKDKNKLNSTTFEIGCQVCSMNFNSKIEYDVHLEDNHKIKNICSSEEEEDRISNLLEDIIPLNKTVNRFKCSLCSKVFGKKFRLQIHMRLHTNDRPYKCDKCPSAFTVSANLKNHIIYKHTEDRPYECKYDGCGAKFKLYDLRRQHENRHLPAKYQCEVCGNGYKSKPSLLRHQQSKHVDSSEWRNQCEYCHKRFAQPEYLADHIRIHTEEKPFGCNICNKFFRRKSALREHKKLHSDERRYVCRFCNKAFKQVAGYWGHMKRHSTMN